MTESAIKKPKSLFLLITFLSAGTYFFSYITRINYAAIIVELVSEKIVTKPQAAVVTTVAFITYGVGQLVSGYIGDRFSPRLLIYFGYLTTVSMNFLIPFCSSNYILMAVIWGINGIAQAFMWPPLLKIMSSTLNDSEYSKAIPFVGFGSALATIFVYLLSPFVITYLNWKYVFYISASIAFLFSFVWLTVTGKVLKNTEIKLKKLNTAILENKNQSLTVLIRLIPIIMLTIAIQGILRDGISTWMPTFMSESFKLNSSSSILTAVVLPIFHMVSSVVTYQILKLMHSDVFKTITLLFTVCAVLLTVLALFGLNSAVISVILIAFSMGAIHGINLLQTGYIPKYYIGMNSVSTIGGIMNFSTYIGSAASTYLFAVISDLFGWKTTVIFWVCFALAGLLINFAVQKIFGRSCKETAEI